jgi:endonuclease YncB( thermonuclease family)
MHLLAMALAAAVVIALCGVAHSEPIERWRIRVKDGDTIRLHGETINTRLVGFDTPETGPPDLRCDEEKVLGERARRRLVELLDAGEIDIEHVGADRYDRPLARLRVNGEDVGAILIRERLAVPYRGRGPKMDWCPRRRR